MDNPYNVSKLVADISTDWKDVLEPIVSTHEPAISDRLKDDYAKFEGTLALYPPAELVFNAFKHFPFKDLRVCIIGQDVYINEGEAHGLAFSVPNGIKCPPSLRNIFKELEAEFGITRKETDLTDWAQQGVLLLNRGLTVLQGKSGYHLSVWSKFTEDVLKHISTHSKNVVYMLWGAHAQQLASNGMIDKDNNLVLTSVHPSPLAQTRGKTFVGNNHFTMANEYLESHGKKKIKWL